MTSTYTTVGHSNEPVGISFDPGGGRLWYSDDVRGSIFEVDFGPDGEFDTNDDVTRELRNIDPSCPAPVPDGAYEHLTVAGVSGVNGSLELSGTRSFPSVRVVAGCLAVQEPKTVRAWLQDVVERVVMPSPMLLLAPAGSDPNLTVSADRTSFTVRSGAWTWTFTPTLAR